MAIIPEIWSRRSELEAIRRDIHAHPELGFDEHRTAALVAEHLSRAGIPVRKGYGGTGLVGTLTGARGDGPVIGLRADMDALPIAEETDVAHRSTAEGVMHACGHDGHTAMLLGAAQHLARDRDFAGTVQFIFQPAEELLRGAHRMIADGLFEDFPMEAVYSIHNDPKLPVGTVMTKPGNFMAGADHFDLEVIGRSGHAARPEDSVDPVVIAANIVTVAQSIVSRRVKTTDPAVLTFSKLVSGRTHNVIPDRAELAGTVRFMNPAMSDLIQQALRELATGIAGSFGGRAELNFRRVCPVLTNTAKETEVAEASVLDVLDQGRIQRPPEPIMGTEDFAYMVEGRGGCLVRLGTRPGDGEVPGLHNSKYDFNDEILPVGASIWVRVVERGLAA